jgi:PadR family transcriptional regulator PadR
VPELVLLRLLSEKEMYGYEIVQAIEARTKAAFTFGEGCIYPLLHYLEEIRLVSSQPKEVGGRSRHYYRLTPRGRRRLEELREEWDRVAAGVSLFMETRHA